jgi:hypothetical protein
MYFGKTMSIQEMTVLRDFILNTAIVINTAVGNKLRPQVLCNRVDLLKTAIPTVYVSSRSGQELPACNPSSIYDLDDQLLP